MDRSLGGRHEHHAASYDPDDDKYMKKASAASAAAMVAAAGSKKLTIAEQFERERSQYRSGPLAKEGVEQSAFGDGNGEEGSPSSMQTPQVKPKGLGVVKKLASEPLESPWVVTQIIKTE